MNRRSNRKRNQDKQERLKVPNRKSTAKKLKPRPHQRKANKDHMKVLKMAGNDVRAKSVMACGSGKTLLGQMASQSLDARRTLLTEPSLALSAQNLNSWMANADKDTEFLVVCSDQTVVKTNADEAHIDLNSLPARVTSSPDEIAAFLRSTDLKKVVISTLHSSHLIAKAQKKKRVPRFDLSVIDEAHRTATKESSVFTTVLDQEQIRSRARLFMTATPRIYTGKGSSKEQVFSMDDESVYGETAHSLPFSQAVRDGLLTDFQFVVATISESETKVVENLIGSSMSTRDALAMLAFYRASQKYKLSKVISFHSTVKRAQSYASEMEDMIASLSPRKKTSFQSINGKMNSDTRKRILDIYSEAPERTLSVVTNCQVLKEGVDVPTTDGVVFFDKKKSEIDIVQAVGRAMRLSPTKEIGTVMVPVVVPDGADPDKILSSSEFDKVWQVVRALKAHDDDFEARCKYLHNGKRRKKSNEESSMGQQSIFIEATDIPLEVKKKISAKVVSIGHGALKDILTEEMIVEAIRKFKDKYGKYPISSTKEEVPGLPNETWKSIDNSGENGFRGLEKGMTLGQIKIKHNFNRNLTEEEIVEAIIKFEEIHGKYPTRDSEEKVPGLPDDNWTAINNSGQKGHRGLEIGLSLAEIKRKHGLTNDLDENLIVQAMTLYKEIHGTYPSVQSKEQVPGLPNENWNAIDMAGRKGHKGLQKGMSLSKIKKKHGLKKELSVELIVEAILAYQKIHGKYPVSDTKDPVPGMPEDTWKALNSAGAVGIRGLKKGRTLAWIKRNKL